MLVLCAFTPHIICEVRFKLINQVIHCIQNRNYTCRLLCVKLTGRIHCVQEQGAEGNI